MMEQLTLTAYNFLWAQGKLSAALLSRAQRGGVGGAEENLGLGSLSQVKVKKKDKISEVLHHFVSAVIWSCEIRPIYGLKNCLWL